MVDVEGEYITVRLGTHACYSPDDDNDGYGDDDDDDYDDDGYDGDCDDDGDDGTDGDDDDDDGDDDATRLAFVSRQISPK